MQRLCSNGFAAQVPANLHEATGIVRNNVLGPRLGNGKGFIFGHGSRNVRKLYGESSPKTATVFRVCHFHKFNASHAAEEFSRSLFHLEFTQEVASIMIGDFMRKSCS